MNQWLPFQNNPQVPVKASFRSPRAVPCELPMNRILEFSVLLYWMVVILFGVIVAGMRV